MCIDLRNVRKQLLHWLEGVPRDTEPRIGAMGALRLEAHSGAVAAASARHLVVSAAGMPGEADKGGTEIGGILLVKEVVNGSDGGRNLLLGGDRDWIGGGGIGQGGTEGGCGG